MIDIVDLNVELEGFSSKKIPSLPDESNAKVWNIFCSSSSIMSFSTSSSSCSCSE